MAVETDRVRTVREVGGMICMSWTKNSCHTAIRCILIVSFTDRYSIRNVCGGKKVKTHIFFSKNKQNLKIQKFKIQKFKNGIID